MDEISDQLNRYFAPTIFLFGVLGNVLNCFILSQRCLRMNPCVVYFLSSSVFNLISILFGLTTRILAGWQLDPTSHIDWICQCRAFVVFTCRTIALWLIMLATIDRWLLSSMNFRRRQMSNLRNTYRAILVASLLVIVLYSHMIVCYKSNLHQTPLRCYGTTTLCRLMTDFIYILGTILFPSIIMICFCLMIVSNVHQLHLRVRTITIVSIIVPSQMKELKLKKTDYQLLRMLLVQVILLVIFCIPQAIAKLYITFQPFAMQISPDDTGRIFYNTGLLLAYIASGMPFYLYTLSGGVVFRRASIQFLRVICQKLTCT